MTSEQIAEQIYIGCICKVLMAQNWDVESKLCDTIAEAAWDAAMVFADGGKKQADA